MKKLWRMFRGIAGLGIVWGALWGAIGAGIGIVIGIVNPAVWVWSNPIVEWALGMGMYGLVSGGVFGKALAFIEGRKTLGELSLKRVATWGLLGAAFAPLFFGALGFFVPGTTAMEVVGAMVVTGLLGGLSAPGTLLLARRPTLPSGEGSYESIAEAEDTVVNQLGDPNGETHR